jgi:RHS repeat-associated protein
MELISRMSATQPLLPDGQTESTSYVGNTATMTDQVNRKIQRITDGLGRLATVNEQDVATGSLTQSTNYSYDYLNNLTQVDQGLQQRKFKYDALSRMLYERIPEQSATIIDGPNTWTTKFTYTSFNAVATGQDARGVITTYGYDSLNRLTQQSYNTVSGVTTAPTVTYTYDSYGGNASNGAVVRIQVGTAYEEWYGFDTQKRVSSMTKKLGTYFYTTSYQYNDRNQLTRLTYPSGRAVTIGHDTRGRVNGLTDVGSGTNYMSSVGYNDAGQVTGLTLGNGVQELYGYDTNRLQLTSQKAGTTAPHTNRMDLTYNYQAAAGQMGAGSTTGNAGQLMSIGGTIGGSTENGAYTYDNLARLVTSNQTSNGLSAQRRFGYDRWGNRAGMWDAVSGGNQIQSITIDQTSGVENNRIKVVSGQAYSYDSAGNLLNDGAHSYTYDSENRLVGVDGGSTGSYAYDHQNRRYKKTIGSTVTDYVWEGSRAVAEHNGSTAAVLIDYIYSGSRVVAKIASGSTQYFLSDRLSLRVVLDTSGNVLGRQGHLPFGEDFGESGTQEKHHFTSYERDGESGTDYAVNRQYSQIVGRFNRPDPKRSSCESSQPQSANRYGYTRNDPVNSMDPLGLDEVFPDPLAPKAPINYNILCSLFPEYCGGGGGGELFEIIRDEISETGSEAGSDVTDFDWGFAKTTYKFSKWEPIPNGGGLIKCTYTKYCGLFNDRATCGDPEHYVITTNPARCRSWLQTVEFWGVAFGKFVCSDVGSWKYIPGPEPCS